MRSCRDRLDNFQQKNVQKNQIIYTGELRVSIQSHTPQHGTNE